MELNQLHYNEKAALLTGNVRKNKLIETTWTLSELKQEKRNQADYEGFGNRSERAVRGECRT